MRTFILLLVLAFGGLSVYAQKATWITGVARNPHESANPELWRGLVGLWVPSVGVQGMRLWDFSPHRNHGTMTNMTQDDWAGSSKGGWTLNFDGSDDHVALGDALLVLNGKTSFAASMWIKPDVINFTGHRGIISRGISATRTPWIWGPSGANTIRINLETSAGIIDVSSPALTAGVWTHIVFSWDGATCTVYKDGIAGNTDSLGGDIENQDSDAAIGLIVGFDTWDGALENLAVWDRSLTVSEVAELHQNRYGSMLRVVERPTSWFVVPAVGGKRRAMVILVQ